MKKQIYIILLVIPFLLVGCNSTNTKTKNTPNKKNEIISDITQEDEKKDTIDDKKGVNTEEAINNENNTSQSVDSNNQIKSNDTSTSNNTSTNKKSIDDTSKSSNSSSHQGSSQSTSNSTSSSKNEQSQSKPNSNSTTPEKPKEPPKEETPTYQYKTGNCGKLFDTENEADAEAKEMQDNFDDGEKYISGVFIYSTGDKWTIDYVYSYWE